MLHKTRVMIYVDNVAKEATFWSNTFDATLFKILELPDDFQARILTLSDEFELGLYPKAFMTQYEPELLGTTPPSMMFFRSDFMDLHQKITTAGDIVENNGILTFNFSDPEGNHFVIAKG